MADPREVLDRWAPEPTTTVRYGDGPDHLADVWLPDAARARAAGAAPALVVVIHGGFWRSGFDRTRVRPMVEAFVQQGNVVAAIEYRRTGEGGDGGWPATFDDVRAALEALPSLVLDITWQAPAATVLVGHSAGGQLALWAGAQVQIPALAGVVSLGGVCDLVLADELELDGPGEQGAVATLLGGRAADQPERYAAADPMQLPPAPAPIVLIHGVDDRIVPVELSRRYAAYAAAHGAEVRLVELPGVEHFGPIDPLSPAWPNVAAAVADLTGP